MKAPRKAGRPKLGKKAKQHVSLRLDPDVLAKFKQTGKGWQSRINDALRRATPPTVMTFRQSAPKNAAEVPKAVVEQIRQMQRRKG